MFSFRKKQLGDQPQKPRDSIQPLEQDPLLLEYFERINRQHFDGFLEAPVLKWNSRLRSSGGRFTPGSRMFPTERRPTIEVASYLQEEKNGLFLVADTLAHEMIHYWLWERRRPYGHTDEFWAKMTQMGVSRYNTVPKLPPFKYLFRCPGCGEGFVLRKKFRGPRACATCCKKHNRGRYDSRFRLVLEREYSPAEGSQTRAELLKSSV